MIISRSEDSSSSDLWIHLNSIVRENIHCQFSNSKGISRLLSHASLNDLLRTLSKKRKNLEINFLKSYLHLFVKTLKPHILSYILRMWRGQFGAFFLRMKLTATFSIVIARDVFSVGPHEPQFI